MKKTNKHLILALAAALTISLAGCASSNNNTATIPDSTLVNPGNQRGNRGGQMGNSNITSTSSFTTDYSADTLFTERDLKQEADLSQAKAITVSDGQSVTISEEGVYVLSGNAKNATVIVEADDSAKVQLVLNGLNVTNEDFPVIYVKSADKVFVTLNGENYLAVTGTFKTDGTEEVDAVIYAKDDITLNGTGSLIVKSSVNGITGKDDVKITGGSYDITAANHGIKGKDSVRIYDGSFTINAGKDGIHSSNDSDEGKGYIYIANGTFNITAKSDGIQAVSVLQIADGDIIINGAEGLEATYVLVDGGNISINASDDGINATLKGTSGTPTIMINGGEVTVKMGAGDTDALDANGNLYIKGGTVNITAQSAFDYDGEGVLSGGTVYVNNQQVSTMTNSMMNGGGFGGKGGGYNPGGNGNMNPGGNGNVNPGTKPQRPGRNNNSQEEGQNF
ncbi:MAG: carbohydrate-binding domain-containing protein [Erysipelotrichaceae bacterium]|nr:carbohydrate-binding domain-containing protein [Erysipelotrichaceae bacterium]